MIESIKKIIGILSVRVWIFIVVIFLFMGFFVFAHNVSKQSDKTISVKTPQFYTVGNSSLYNKKITVSGVVKPVDSATVVAKTQGSIIRFSVKAGDVFRKSDVLAEIDHTTIDAQLKVAEAKYVQAQNEYKQRIVLRDSARKQAEIGIKSAGVSSSSSDSTVLNNLNYVYRGAYDTAGQVLSTAIISLVFLSDERSAWKGISNSSNIADATNSLIKSSGILLGADSTSSLWDSSYLIKLNGGVQKILNIINKQQVDGSVLDNVLKKLEEGISLEKQGLISLKSVVMLSGSKTEVDLINKNIISVENSMQLIVNTMREISFARLSVKNNNKKNKIISAQAQQTLVDSARSYEAEKFSAKSAVNSALANVEYIKTKRRDFFIIAPFDGVVTDKFASFGQSVLPGSKIISIASSSGWKAVFAASDAFSSFIKKGAEVKVFVKNIQKPIASSITRVIPRAQVGSMRIRFEVDLPKLSGVVYDGMVVTASIKGASVEGNNSLNEKSFLIPNEFIGYDYDGAYVVTDNGLRINIMILLRKVDYSIIKGDEIKDGMKLKNPLLY